MPCTAKKFECGREEMGRDYVPDVDYVLTTRELGAAAAMFGIDLDGDRAGGGRHAVRRALDGGQDLRRQRRRDGSGGPLGALPAHRQGAGRPEDPAAARAQGLQGTARQDRRPRSRRGGRQRPGQRPQAAGRDPRRAQGPSLHRGHDLPGRLHQRRRPAAATPTSTRSRRACRRCTRSTGTSRCGCQHKNKSVQRLYEEFLGKPLGEKSHHLLHTHYHQRDVLV